MAQLFLSTLWPVIASCGAGGRVGVDAERDPGYKPISGGTTLVGIAGGVPAHAYFQVDVKGAARVPAGVGRIELRDTVGVRELDASQEPRVVRLLGGLVPGPPASVGPYCGPLLPEEAAVSRPRRPGSRSAP